MSTVGFMPINYVDQEIQNASAKAGKEIASLDLKTASPKELNEKLEEQKQILQESIKNSQKSTHAKIHEMDGSVHSDRSVELAQ
jgi:hypothetical protein